MAKLVFDASVFLSWLFPDEENDWSKGLVRALHEDDRILVPAHWTSEIANGLLVGYRRKRIKAEQISEYLDQLVTIPIEVEPALPLGEMKLVVALCEKHSLTVYDAAYLYTAKKKELPLATLDTSLCRAAKAENITLL